MFRLVELPFGQRTAAQPRRRLENLRRVALLGPALRDDRFGAGQIVRRKRRAHLRDEGDRTGGLTEEQKRRQRECQSVHDHSNPVW